MKQKFTSPEVIVQVFRRQHKLPFVNKLRANSAYLTFIILIVFIVLIYYSFAGNFELGSKIGDTLNGLTAPIISLLSAWLIYKTLKAQIAANAKIQDQIDNDAEDKSLNQLFSFLDKNIDNFKFRTLPVDDLANVEEMDTETESTGGEAFYKLFNQIRCHYHGTEEDLDKNQSISELWSILNVMDNLLERLENTTVKSKETFKSLVEHLFLYKMTTRIKDATCVELERYLCGSCGVDHGLPDKIRDLVGKIRVRLGIEIIEESHPLLTRPEYSDAAIAIIKGQDTPSQPKSLN